MDGILQLITHFGPIAVIMVIFAESGMMAGFFLPGDSLLFVAGTLTQQGIFAMHIAILVPLLFLAAVAGNTTGYFMGQKFGKRLFRRPDSRFFRQEHLQAAEKFYLEHGHKAIVLAMFVPIIRAFSPVVAGISKMHYRTFITYNLIGAFIWTVGFTLLGYFAGAWIQSIGINIEIAALIIIALSLAPGLYHVLKEPENRAKIRTQVKKQATRVKNTRLTRKKSAKSTPVKSTKVAETIDKA